eukprot:m51a1_g3184 hypothetical protein (178) ;mRNA; f:421343-422684
MASSANQATRVLAFLLNGNALAFPSGHALALLRFCQLARSLVGLATRSLLRSHALSFLNSTLAREGLHTLALLVSRPPNSDLACNRTLPFLNSSELAHDGLHTRTLYSDALALLLGNALALLLRRPLALLDSELARKGLQPLVLCCSRPLTFLGFRERKGHQTLALHHSRALAFLGL